MKQAITQTSEQVAAGIGEAEDYLKEVNDKVKQAHKANEKELQQMNSMLHQQSELDNQFERVVHVGDG